MLAQALYSTLYVTRSIVMYCFNANERGDRRNPFAPLLTITPKPPEGPFPSERELITVNVQEKIVAIRKM